MKTITIKSMYILTIGFLILNFTVPVHADVTDYRGDSDRTHFRSFYNNRLSARTDYKLHHKYPPDLFYYKNYHKISKEINRNKGRIRKLEKKAKKCYLKRYHSNKSDYRNYTVEIKNLEYEISRLEKRNHYLRRISDSLSNER